MPKISLPVIEMVMGFRRPPQHNFNVTSSWVKMKLHTTNQPPSLLNYGDSCEEDLKIKIWKTTSI